MIYIGADLPIIFLSFSEVSFSRPKSPAMMDWFPLKVASTNRNWNSFPGLCPGSIIVSSGNGPLDMYGSYMLTDLICRMSEVKIITVAKELPVHSRETKHILPFVDVWLADRDDRFRRKVIKIFEGAAVDKRYGIMDIEEVFTSTSFEGKNNIYVREVKKLGSNVI